MTGKGKWRAAAVAMRVLESQGDMAQGASDVSSSDQEDAVAIKEESEEEEEEGQQGGEEERGGGAARQVKLPQGGLLKPAVVRAAGLTAPKAKNTPGGKPKGTCKPGGEKGISTVDDDFADIAAVIAQAASKSGREAAAEGLEGAIKAPKKVKKTRHAV